MNEEKTKKAVKRGDIFYYNFGIKKGSIQSGARPVVVLQCNEGNVASPTTIVAAITSSSKKQYLPSHVIINNRFGLKMQSMIMLEQISTVNQNGLEKYIGYIDDEQITRIINNALMTVLGMRNSTHPQERIKSLCNNCLENYRINHHYIISRVNPLSKAKAPCEICGQYGYRYFISQRKKHGRNNGVGDK